MGMAMGISNCSMSTPANPLPAPNPTRFRIVEVEQFGSALVAMVHYPDCTNYEGRKILVYADMTPIELLRKSTLDPHFTKESGPVARMEPTPRGWSLAQQLAKVLAAGGEK